VKDIADELEVVDIPEFFGAVSQFYRRFHQVGDAEVAQLLAA
jgi:predicted phosphoribosyltransferase